MRTRQVILYILNNLNNAINTNINNFDNLIDEFIKLHSNNADKQIEKYYFDYLV